ncbi:hypothetical protein [Desulfosediminicola ganghwensis]|nr:hypothetical protein [Desulfosediminicola ganghwensis]
MSRAVIPYVFSVEQISAPDTHPQLPTWRTDTFLMLHFSHADTLPGAN